MYANLMLLYLLYLNLDHDFHEQVKSGQNHC